MLYWYLQNYHDINNNFMICIIICYFFKVFYQLNRFVDVDCFILNTFFYGNVKTKEVSYEII